MFSLFFLFFIIIIFTTLIAAIHSLKQCICFCHRKNGSHPIFEVLSIYLDRRTCGHPLFGSFLQQYYVYFKKKLVPAMRSLKGTIIIYMEYSLPSILSTVWYIFSDVKMCSHTSLAMQILSAYFGTPVTIKQFPYKSSCIFRAELIILKREHLKQSFFRRKNFSDYLVVWNSCFFLISTPR